jgi:uncharacterized protein YndB with AHSA1/START domain
MTERSATHATFTIERRYEATPQRVFAAWATPEARARWFVGPEGWQQIERSLDFRIGGKERLRGRFPSGLVTEFNGHYLDIVPEKRIILAYDVYLDAKRISLSLATVEFLAVGAGALMVFTEQAAFLDGFSDPGGRGREQGTRSHFDRLEAVLRG